MGFRLLLILLLILTGSTAYKFLIVSPLWGHSHTTFMGKIADALTDAGHNVTLFMPVIDTSLVDRTGVKSTKNVILHKVDPRADEKFQEFRRIAMSNVWNTDTDAWNMIKMSGVMSEMFAYSCENVIKDDSIWSQLKSERFDVGITEPFSICGLVMFEKLKIASLGASSSIQLDPVSYAIGEPIAPSYVPAGTLEGIPKGMIGRIDNLMTTFLGIKFFTTFWKAEIEVVRKTLNGDFPGYNQLLAKMSYFFTNSNPLLNYPRPIIHKTVDIGGLSVSNTKFTAKDLGEWDQVLRKRKLNVLISFGSMVKSKEMPQRFKEGLLSVFEAMSDVTFIWKYEEPTNITKHLNNVYISPWLPQNALLADNRISAFMTHGGLGSSTEVTHLGKPAICVPLFAEQPHNCGMLAHHGVAIVLQKKDLANKDFLRKTLKNILNEKSYSENAKKLSEMLKNGPISPKEALVRHAEFVARFGPVTHLDPYGRNLSIFEYYFIDVFSLLIVILFTVYKIIFALISKCKFSRKEKHD